MKHYIGCKIIKAKPCVKVNGQMHDVLPDIDIRKGHIIEQGYRVVYEDGYESFSPKKVFEKAYIPCAVDGFIEPEDFIATTTEFVSETGKGPDIKVACCLAHLVNGDEVWGMKADVGSCFDEKLYLEEARRQMMDKVQKKLMFLTRTARIGVRKFYEKD